MGNEKFVVITFESISKDSAGGIGRLSYGLCSYLNRNDHDVLFYTINKGPHSTPFPSESVHWSSRYFLFLLNFIFKRGWIGSIRKRKLEEFYFDYFLSKKNFQGDYLVCTTAFIPRTLKKHAHSFKRTCYIPPTPNEIAIFDMCKRELSTYGVVEKYHDIYIDKKRLANFKRCIPCFTKIISHSPVSTKSFLSTGIPIAETSFIHVPNRSEVISVAPVSSPVKFLYIAYSVMLKGLHRLLDEWVLADNAGAELHIVGPISKNYQDAFHVNDRGCKNIFFHGFQVDATPFYLDSDIVIIPSLIDGEPHIATEALSLGKPVLISEGCGYSGFMKEKFAGSVFDVFKMGDLAAKINQASGDLASFRKNYVALFDFVKSVRTDYDTVFQNITKEIKS